MSKQTEQKTYEFGDFRLDAVHLMLYRNENEVSLPPKAVETLLALVERNGQVVSKEELMEIIWKGSIVEESNLSQYLHTLRNVLGRKADDKPFIETLRRRGYRFKADVRLGKPIFLEPEKPVFQTDGRMDGSNQEPNQDLAVLVENQRIRTISQRTSLAPHSRPVLTAAAILITLFFVSSAVFWLRISETPQTIDGKGDLTILHITNGIAVADATLSPDGKYFVYHEQDGETAHIWLQQVGQSNRIEIVPPAARTILGKTFTPDSKFVYFVVRERSDGTNSLYRVPTIGGVSTKVLEDIDSAVSFSPDGKEMVFRRGKEGDPAVSLIIATVEDSKERTLYVSPESHTISGSPAWSPDGRAVAFGVVDVPPGTMKNSCVITAIDLRTEDHAEPLSEERWDNCYRMAWTHDGKNLVFIGTKFDEGYSTRRDQIYVLSLETRKARRLTTDGSRHQVTSLGVAADGEILAVPFNRSSQIWAMDPNGDSRTAIQITHGQSDGRAGIAPIADGRVGYISRSGDNLNIWIMNGDGTQRSQLISDPPLSEELRSLTSEAGFVFSATQNRRNHLFSIKADGTNLRQLTFGNGYEIDSTVSPNGRSIIYASNFDTGGAYKIMLWRFSTDGGEPTRLSDFECNNPHFSPNGQYVSCIHDKNKIAILSADDGSVISLFETSVTPILNIGARWTPDGKNLAYLVERKGVSNIWLQPVDGAASVPLTDFTSGSIYNFAFSVDGAKLYLARGYQIYDAVIIKGYR